MQCSVDSVVSVQPCVPVGVVVTSYLVMADPPSEAGACQVTLTEAFPAISVTEVGLPGTVDGVTGPAVTPWVLARLHEASGGRSLVANRRLLVDNAGLAAEIAAAYFAA